MILAYFVNARNSAKWRLTNIVGKLLIREQSI